MVKRFCVLYCFEFGLALFFLLKCRRAWISKKKEKKNARMKFSITTFRVRPIGTMKKNVSTSLIMAWDGIWHLPKGI